MHEIDAEALGRRQQHRHEHQQHHRAVEHRAEDEEHHVDGELKAERRELEIATIQLASPCATPSRSSAKFTMKDDTISIITTVDCRAESANTA